MEGEGQDGTDCICERTGSRNAATINIMQMLAQAWESHWLKIQDYNGWKITAGGAHMWAICSLLANKYVQMQNVCVFVGVLGLMFG